MADIRFNKQTGEAVMFDGSQWVPTKTAANKQTGEVVAFDGANWVPVGGGKDVTAPRPGETETQTFMRLYGGTPQQRPGAGETSMRGALQGGTLGFGDEIVAAGAAALDPMRGALGMGRPAGGTYGERYDAYLARERAKLAQGRKDMPVVAYGSEVAGAIPTSMVGALNVARGGNLARMVGTGAVQGGIYGAGASEGGAADRAIGAGVGAGTGGAVGVALYPITKGIGNLASSLATGRAAKQVGVSKPVYNIMGRTMSADDALTGQGAANIRSAGPEAMIADAGDTASGLLDTAIQKGGPAARIARSNIGERVTGASKEVSKTLDDVLGTPQGVKTAAKGIAQRTSAGRSEAYEKAFQSSIDYAAPEGRAIEEVVGRIPKRVLTQAVDTANDAMVSEGRQNLQIMAQVAEDGGINFVEMPNVEQLNALKVALGNMGRESVDQFGRPTSSGNMYSRLATDLRDAMVKAAPSYKDALSKGFDKIEMDKGLRLGRELLRPGVTREDVTIALRGLSDVAKKEARIGLRGHVDDMMAQVKSAMTDPNVDARETLKMLKDFSSRASREKVFALLGKEDASKLYGVMDRAQKTFGLRAKVAENSKTFARQEASKIVSDEAQGGVMSSIRHAEPVEAAKSLARTMMGRSEAQKQAISDEIYGELAKMLTGPRGEDAATKLRLLSQSIPQVRKSASRGTGLARQLMTPAPAISGGVAGRNTGER